MKTEAVGRPIPITKTLFGSEELRAVQEVLESGWVVQGPHVARFEEGFSRYTNAPHAVATSSCTTALHIAVAALGLRPGDEVIVPAFTWVATANVVEYMGATPVFCDIDLRTFNIDAAAIEPLINDRTVGIIPVHLFGLCADMQAILETARRHHLWVVEDAACALGAFHAGRHAGTMGDMGCFSFHPRKSITTGEGGMLTTASEDHDQLARSLRDHGASRSDLARHTQKSSFLLAEYKALGYNYRMTDIQAAIGCAQMDRLSWILAERARRARGYSEQLRELEWLETPTVAAGYVHGYQAYVCLFRPDELRLADVPRLYAERNALMARLEQRGISTRQGTHAAALQQYYAEKYKLRPEQVPNSYRADRLTLALPLYPQMTDDDLACVVSELRRAFAER